MSTYIHGIAASENIDTSGEIVSIAGLDISSLDRDGVINWEHKSDQPSQVVGKILKAKKIFSDADCDDDHQLHFWEKCKTPFVYIMGELLDDYSDSAREVAAKFRYDADHSNERNMMNFSIEGSKISKSGITVDRSIARKVTCTILPCNKQAIAEMITVDPKNPKKSAIDELFKTEAVEIEVFTPSPRFLDLLKKEDPNKYAAKLGIKPFNKNTFGGQSPDNQTGSAIGGTGAPSSAGGLLASEKMAKAAPNLSIVPATTTKKPHERGNQIGLTSGGHGVFSHGMVGDYSHFSHKDHAEAATAHQRVSDASRDPKIKMHHANKAKLHSVRGHAVEAAGKNRAERAQKLQTTASTAKPNLGTNQKLHHPGMSGTVKPPGPAKKNEMNKALDAGSALAGPANLSQGAALGKEELEKRMQKAGQSGIDPQSGSDPGTSRINKPLRSKDSRVQVLNPQVAIGKSELRKDAANPKMAPKDVKVKQLQTQIDAGTYKPDANKIAGSMLQHPEKPLKGTKVQKSEWLQRAESEYASWNKREQFETFMQKRLPHLTRSEIQVIGQTMLLQKSLKQEKLLKDFYNPSMLRSEKK